MFAASIIGCGRIAGIRDKPRKEGNISTHAQAYHRHNNFTMLAACDNEESRLEAFRTCWSIPDTFTDLEEMLVRTGPDVVSVCTPTIRHYSDLVTLLKSPVRPHIIFVEKPVCGSQAELLEIERLARKCGTKILVNHTRRFDQNHRELAEQIQKNGFGPLVDGHCVYYGGWMNNGSHLVDTLRMLLREELCICGVKPGAPGREGDPCWDVELEIGNASISVKSFDENYYQLYEIDLRFEQGRVQLRNFGEEIIIQSKESNEISEVVLVSKLEPSGRGLQDAIYHAVDSIASHLRGEMELSETGALLEDTRGTMKLLWEVEQFVQ